MTLRLNPDQWQQLSAHAEGTYPEECCGVLLGKIDRTHSPASKILLEIWAVSNAWSLEIAADLNAVLPLDAPALHPLGSDKTDRYWIDPKDLLRAQRYARDQQWEIIGIYHSHPDHPAVPSECDRRLAWAQYSYLIVSVCQGTAQAIGCWILDETHQFQAEALVLC